jgi:hypothetical protein
MRFEALSQDTGWIALVSLERFGALLRKEKDGASLPIYFRRDSSNIYLHSSFAKTGGFLLSGFALVSQPKSFRAFRGT